MDTAKSYTRAHQVWQAALDPETRAVAECKNVPAMRAILGELNYDDMRGLDVWEEGVSTVGHQVASGIFEKTDAGPPLKLREEVLHTRAE